MTASPTSIRMPALGTVVANKYELKSLIGQGGMGAVFEARHVQLNKRVAIKIMLADAGNDEARKRFLREGQSAAGLESPHIVDIDDVGEENGYAYMILELLQGKDLGQLLEIQPARRFEPHVAIGYVLQAIAGVHQAHLAHIVHRDLKPSNLFLARRPDGSEIVKVLDFGISKTTTLQEKPEALTSTKAMLGSPLYMSPEQLKSSKNVDQRADIWAIGVILYELITGTLPFMGETLGELFAAIIEAAPTPPSTRASTVPPDLDAIIMRCLRASRDERYATVADLARDLQRFASPNAVAQAGQYTQAIATQNYNPGLRGTGSTSNPQMPPVGAVTGSGVHPPVVKGTVPLGAMTPQPPWNQSVNLPTNKNPLIAIGVVVAALMVLVGVTFGGIAYWKTKHAATAGTGTPPPPVSIDVPPPPVSVASVTPPPPSSNVAPPASVASVTPHPTGTIHGIGTHPTGTKKDPDPPRTAEQPPPPPPPPPTAKPTAKPTSTAPGTDLR